MQRLPARSRWNLEWESSSACQSSTIAHAQTCCQLATLQMADCNQCIRQQLLPAF